MPSKKQAKYKPWLKLWSKPWLQGSMQFDSSLEEQAIFIKLLCMANESRNRGVIQANETTPYPVQWLANYLNVTEPVLKRCLDVFISTDRISINGKGIIINNFEFYQDEAGKVERKPHKPKEGPPELPPGISQEEMDKMPRM